MPQHVNSDVELVADLLHSSAIHLLRRAAAADSESGLGRAALSALSVIVFRGPLTVGELAAAEGVRSPSMTRTVGVLDDAGLAVRRPNELDGRSVLVAATPKGARVLRRARARRIAILAEALARLDDAELRSVDAAARTIERLFGRADRPWQPLRAR
jgi:DNA-binding MarR family transcriptional regulator